MRLKKKIKFITGIVLLAIAGFAAVFFIYVSDYYRADHFALQTMNNVSLKTEGSLTILSPTVPSEKGLIFYPGGKVEETAYLPLLEKLCQNGITCVLVKMPFHLAVFDANAAEHVFEELPEIKHWYLSGHSLGGAMASSYASKHPDKIDGLILLGAYVYGDIPLDKTVTIYGSEDLVLNKSKIDDTEHVFVIEGGNHAQFGNYGAQKGDGSPTISADAQQEQAVKIILDFIG